MDKEMFFADNFDSLEGLADWIAEILECPITIEDANHQIISYSKHNTDVDTARVSTIIQRKVPEDVINGLWKQGIMSKLLSSADPVMVPAIEGIGLGSRIALSVWNDKEIIAFIWVQTDINAFGEDKLQLLNKAASLVRKEIMKHNLKRKKIVNNHQEFFWKLLTGYIHEQAEIDRQAKQNGVHVDGHIVVVIIQFGNKVKKAIEQYVHNESGHLSDVQCICHIVDENRLILLVSVRNEQKQVISVEQYVSHIYVTLTDHFHQTPLHTTYGLIYNRSKYIQMSYKQAVKVLHLREQFPHELNNAYGYHQLGIYRFLDELSSYNEHHYYHNYTIWHLREYDDKHHANLMETLYTFLDYDCNVFLAAKQMHIHANTLNYRLKRIVEITKLDLKDPSEKIALYLDMKIDRMGK